MFPRVEVCIVCEGYKVNLQFITPEGVFCLASCLFPLPALIRKRVYCVVQKCRRIKYYKRVLGCSCLSFGNTKVIL